jgi:hypothetical protein
VNDDERLNRYFRSHADLLPVPDRDPAALTDSIAHRRTRRLISVTAAAAAVTVMAVAVVARPQDAGTTSAVGGEAALAEPAPPLRWTAVDEPRGLGWAHRSVVAQDGSIYALSTAPGPFDPAANHNQVYRSGDGKSWDPETLPDGLNPGALGTGGGRVYALGTAPGGGDLIVAARSDQQATWSSSRLPMPRADLAARFPKEVVVTDTAVAAGPGGVVAAVSVKARPDVGALLAAKGIEFAGPFQWDERGVSQWCPNAEVLESVVPPSTPPGSVPERPRVAPSTPPGSGPLGATLRPCDPADEQLYTWEELGLDLTLRELIAGETHLYRSTGDGPFAEVPATLPEGTVQALFGTAGGYRLLIASGSERVAQARSADGITWESSGPELNGARFAADSGLLGGRPAIVYGPFDSGNVRLATADDAGVWTTSEVAMTPPGAQPLKSGLMFLSIGPLGLAAFVWGNDDHKFSEGHIVMSPDGRTVTSTPVGPWLGDGPWNINGITTNADAVVVRLTRVGTKDAPNPPLTPQRLLVGTPS